MLIQIRRSMSDFHNARCFSCTAYSQVKHLVLLSPQNIPQALHPFLYRPYHFYSFVLFWSYPNRGGGGRKQLLQKSETGINRTTRPWREIGRRGRFYSMPVQCVTAMKSLNLNFTVVVKMSEVPLFFCCFALFCFCFFLSQSLPLFCKPLLFEDELVRINK